MQLGVFAALANPIATPEYVATLGREAEARGIDSIWVAEHVVLFDQYDSQYPYAENGRIPAAPGSGILEPYTTLAFLAAVTDRIRLGTGISLIGQRNPLYTAKEVANVDWLSGGRVDLGVGVGWLREEYEACNVEWARRGARMDEYLDLLRVLWTEDEPSFDGEFFTLPRCRMDPKPMQSPLPVWVGGESDAAISRAVARGQGWYGFNREPDQLVEAVHRVEKALAEAGRDRSDFQIAVCPYFSDMSPEKVAAYRDAGADQVIALFWAGEPGAISPTLDGLLPAIEEAHGS